jgi:hypothetical protein
MPSRLEGQVLMNAIWRAKARPGFSCPCNFQGESYRRSESCPLTPLSNTLGTGADAARGGVEEGAPPLVDAQCTTGPNSPHEGQTSLAKRASGGYLVSQTGQGR